ELLGIGGTGAIEIAEDVGPLQELARRNHRLEPIARHEIIVHAVGLALARAARGIGPGHFELRRLLDQTLDERRLAGPGRRRDDEQETPRGACREPVEGLTRHSGPARASSRVPLWRR